MKTKIYAIVLCLTLVLGLAACGSKSEPAASSLDGLSGDELWNKESEILSENQDVWNKVFAKMPAVTEDTLGRNYGEVLMEAVENTKEELTDEEYQFAKEAAETIRDIEARIAELPQNGADLTESAPDSSAFPQFTGKDFDGNDVDSSLFAGNIFTVVNFWFNGCKPCVGELSELNALNERIREQGGEIIGVNSEAMGGNETIISEAKEILESQGAKYRNIYFDADTDGAAFANSILAFPTTYVVDRNGNIVGEPILGAITSDEEMQALQANIDAAIAQDTAK